MGFKRSLVVCLSTFMLLAMFRNASAQGISKVDRGRAEQMLTVIGEDVNKHYYDPKIHGTDWNARVAEYKQKIENADSMNLALSIVAAALDSLNDSHTFFLPPQRPYTHDFGWQIEMVGDKCFVTQVRPKSDAESKGVKAGDQLVSVNGFPMNADNLRKMNYAYNILRPQPSLHISLLSPAGQPKNLEIMARIRQFKRVMDITGENDASDIWQLIRQEEAEDHLIRARIIYAKDVMILKLPEFSNWSNSEIWDMLKKSRDYKALIIDLRQDPGGSVDTLNQIISHIFPDDVKIGDHVARNGTKTLTVKANHHDQFTGKLIVLVDSQSASASEIFARLVQLQKRGVVLGDHSAGAVMEAKHYNYTSGMDTVVFYGASITEADIIMTDGKSLEHLGVTPDEVILPTPDDLASGRDPVLTRAMEIGGEKIDPVEAGKMFPYEWAPE